MSAVSLPQPRIVGRIAKTELRRRWRNLSELQFVAFALVGLMGLAFFGFLAFGSYIGGQMVHENPTEVMRQAPAVAAGLWLFTAFMSVIRSFSRGGKPDRVEAMLTTRPHRDVLAGLMLAEFGFIAVYFVPVVLVVTLGFTAGAGTPLTLLTLSVAAALAVVSAFTTAYVVGFAVRALLSRSPILVRLRSVIGLVAMFVYLWAIVSNSFGSLGGRAVTVLQSSPVGWFAHLALIGTVPNANPGLAAAAAAIGVVSVPVGLLVGSAIAGWYWFSDEPASNSESGEEASKRTTDGRFGRLGSALTIGGIVARPTAAIARKSWLRARRAPLKLSYVIYPVFFLYGPLRGAFQGGGVPASVVPVVGLYGAWAVGAAFALNPLGDEGAVLPITITSGVSGRNVVLGTMLAGLVPGVPLVALLTAVLAVLSPLSAAAALGSVGFAVLVCVGATTVAVGVGTAFPRFSEARISRNRKAVVPSFTGFAVYSVALGLLWIPGALGQIQLLTDFVAELLGVAPSLLSALSLVVTAVLFAVVGSVSAGLAVRKFDRFRLS